MKPENYKMLIFDLDGTLCPPGKGLRQEDIHLLRQLKNSGRQLVICSGKSSFYLCGLVRQLELDDMILIGENGCTFQFGQELPPVRYYTHPCPPKAFEQLADIKAQIAEVCKDHIWFQPNEVALTVFPRDPQTFDAIQELVDSRRDRLNSLTIYRHFDSFDFVPTGISKNSALAYLSELTGISYEEMIAFGDGINDLPMFDYTSGKVIIGEKIDYPGALRFSTISEALHWMLE